MYAELTSHFMLGVVPGGGDGGGYSLKCPALVRGGCALKGYLYGRGGISQVELFERVGKSATVNKKYMKRIKKILKSTLTVNILKLPVFLYYS